MKNKLKDTKCPDGKREIHRQRKGQKLRHDREKYKKVIVEIGKGGEKQEDWKRDTVRERDSGGWYREGRNTTRERKRKRLRKVRDTGVWDREKSLSGLTLALSTSSLQLVLEALSGLKKVALRIFTMFVFTQSYEAVFSTININKTKYHSRLNNG